MRIVQTPARFFPFIGGVENYVYNLSKEMVQLGHDVFVICAREPEAPSMETMSGIRVKRLSYVGKMANTNITPALPIALLGQDFDVIHTHLPTPWSADWSALISMAKRKPLVLTYHNDIVGRGWAGDIAKLYNFSFLRLVLEAASKIIITQPNYAISSIYLDRHKNKLRVLPNGVDIDRFRPLGGQKEEGKANKVLFTLGLLDQYHRYKGLDYLLEALAIVRKQVPDVKLLVGGAGELLSHYRDMAARLGLSENVEFLGFVPEERLVEHYNGCDAFVLPSVSSEQEGFGIVLLEAMACEKPVIGTDIVGVAEDVRRCNAGRIVEPRDVNALADAILEIITNGAAAKEMGQRGHWLVEKKYSWKKIGKEMLSVYEEVA